MAIRLVVGLGNPGPNYENTRHNVGFRVLDRFIEMWGGGREEDWKGLGRIAQGSLGGEKCFLVRPMTYMNESGRMVRDFAGFYKVRPQDVLVCFDDLSLPLAKIRLRRGGSSGGQKGMQSIIDHLGTRDIPRLRLGIGPRPPGRDAAGFVLSRFTAAERGALSRALSRAADAVGDWAESGIEFAMNRYNAEEPAGDEA